jgi:hypothetical protein|tara:strand:+ start:417 stop:608 length:192 start_codon:yes stop_codon:yes gene_type:complete
MEIDLKTTVIDAVIDSLEVVESELNKKMDEFEKNNLPPVLTRTDILLFFSRVYDELKEQKPKD